MRAHHAAALGVAAACAAAAPGPRSIAFADGIGGDLPLDGFRPALDARGFVTVDGGEVLAPGEPSFGLVTSWARGLLHLEGGGASYRVDDVVSPTLVAAIGLPGRFGLQLAVAVPFGLVAADRGPDTDGGTPGDPLDDDDGRHGAQGLGDVGVHAKLRLADRGPWAVAVAGGATLPTAAARRWLGSGAVVGEGRVIVEWRGARWRLAGNAGVRVRAGGDAVFTDDAMGGVALGGVPPTGATVALGPAAPVGAAAAWALAPGRLELVGELGALLAARGDVRPVEALGALRVRLAEASHFTFGAGTGLGGGAGSPDLRAFAAIVFEPRTPRPPRAALVPDAPRRPATRPPADRDEDGLLDHEDACPDDPEDHDEFEDDDGCPDPDNDRDGILDRDDLCPLDPEDLDGVEDEDGCPEEERERVRVGETTLDVFEEIHFEFDSAVIQERSHDLLRVIARTILANPDLRLIEIGGHTDERGPAAYNLRLSQRRADAVRAFLVAEGVEADRLEAQGYGEAVPAVKGRGEAAWAANRRVEFVIVRRRR